MTSRSFTKDRLYIDPQAGIIEDKHMQQEGELIKQIGSTGKGCGAALADRIWRKDFKLAKDVLADEFSTLYGPLRAEREERFSGAQTPTQLDDLKPDGTPTQQGVGLERFYGKISPEKAQFITALFKIIRSEHFSMLWRDVIKDKGQLIALEVLVYAKFATPKEIAWAKEVARLEQMLGLVHPEIAKSTLS